jgi:hypothetical protein
MSPRQLSANENKNVDLLEKSLTREDVSKFLEPVSYEESFRFLDGTARPTGEIAISLSDFCSKIRTVSSESLLFHLKRNDFQEWIGEVIGDDELARRLNRIRVKNGVLRDTLHALISSRIQELKDSWSILLVLQ